MKSIVDGLRSLGRLLPDLPPGSQAAIVRDQLAEQARQNQAAADAIANGYLDQNLGGGDGAQRLARGVRRTQGARRAWTTTTTTTATGGREQRNSRGK